MSSLPPPVYGRMEHRYQYADSAILNNRSSSSRCSFPDKQVAFWLGAADPSTGTFSTFWSLILRRLFDRRSSFEHHGKYFAALRGRRPRLARAAIAFPAPPHQAPPLWLTARFDRLTRRKAVSPGKLAPPAAGNPHGLLGRANGPGFGSGRRRSLHRAQGGQATNQFLPSCERPLLYRRAWPNRGRAGAYDRRYPHFTHMPLPPWVRNRPSLRRGCNHLHGTGGGRIAKNDVPFKNPFGDQLPKNGRAAMSAYPPVALATTPTPAWLLRARDGVASRPVRRDDNLGASSG
jgi:hypothetical protein